MVKQRRCAGIMVLSPTGKVVYTNRSIRKFLATLQHSDLKPSSVQALPPPLIALFDELVHAHRRHTKDGAAARLETRILALAANNRSFLIQAFGLAGQTDRDQRVVLTCRETAGRDTGIPCDTSPSDKSVRTDLAPAGRSQTKN